MMEILKALAEPNRFRIVELLRDGPRPVGDMVNRLSLRQPQVSKHLRVLTYAGLVDVSRGRLASNLSFAAHAAPGACDVAGEVPAHL
jgi:DNA-binding transcriptional ArsR family regulator